jgi:hypothetical protein
MNGTYSTHRRDKKCMQNIIVGKPENNRQLGRKNHVQKQNFKMELRETGLICEDVNWIQSAQDMVKW